jgi:DNA-directed RNA polymerase specialized sigma24 family protein
MVREEKQVPPTQVPAVPAADTSAMERSAAMRQLGPTHAQALLLADEGLRPDEIAARLALDPTAIRPVLQVARAKLAALEALDDDPASKETS